MRSPEGFNTIEQFHHDAGGILLLDKPSGMTSFDVIRRLRRILKIKKIGHAGTLDPMATGLLILASKRATKSIDRYQSMFKTYEGELRLGETTASHDAETPVLESRSFDTVTEDDIRRALVDFTGEFQQVPPMYSALKKDGRRLYSLARRGVQIEREARRINVSKFELLSFNKPGVAFRLECSKGTYVRTIAHDIGIKLGCGAHLISLRRTAIGDLRISDAWSIPEIEKAAQNMAPAAV